ncbi:hypothetical protein [Bradyrhizobium iriomotense]|uniref:Uncharacterized protein n=1 Tax=Bradyrhizobium iriomotense TaxID=441950 RepID=A0ABQ6BBT7_9BRAD|nr:hypothetical protein [Bradyrhizobium iriomotense]GLR91316.1 hypothetical protein GCM10007857_80330 [Bradyrhizobium iriomotense]
MNYHEWGNISVTVQNGQPDRFELPARQRLRVQAPAPDCTGLVTRLMEAHSSGDTRIPDANVSVSAGTTATIGPFPWRAIVKVEAIAGRVIVTECPGNDP